MALSENELDPTTLEPGDIVQYESKYYFAGVVLILRDLSTSDQTSYEAAVKDVIFGNMSENEKFTFSRTKDESLQHYVNWKVKEPGSMTDYLTGDIDDHRERMEQIREKYDRSE